MAHGPRSKAGKPTGSPSIARSEITTDDLSRLFAGLKERAQGLLAKEGNPGGVHTTELAVSAVRRQKRASQSWSTLQWANESHFFAAGYKQMVRALKDKARARGRRPDREHAGNLASEFLAPLVAAGALRLSDLAQAPDAPAALQGALAESLEWLQASRPELAETVQLADLAGLRQEDVAALTGVSARSVRNRLALAHGLLAERLIGRFPKIKRLLPGS